MKTGSVFTPIDPGWPDHVISGIAFFQGKKVGSLTREELILLRDKWCPRTLAYWKHTLRQQQADYHAIINALAVTPEV